MEKMMFFYDEEGDVLDISMKDPQPAQSEEVGNDIIVRRDNTGRIIGFTVLNFEKRAEKTTGFGLIFKS